MVVVTVLLLAAYAAWGVHVWRAAGPDSPGHRSRSARHRARARDTHPLTEDEVIRFGVALEATPDVLARLAAETGPVSRSAGDRRRPA